MEYGLSMFITDYSMSPHDLAIQAEKRAFDSIWIPEHTHIPASRKTSSSNHDVLPMHYWHTLDPFIALTSAAMVTKRLKLATGICLVIQRDPIITAKQLASLDQISDGRVILGVGGGWNREEIENHGTPFKLRWKILRERILAMQEIWTKDQAEFHGTHVDFDPIWSWPKPIQKPYPPILMGGNGPTTFDRVVEFCDGWMPNLWGFQNELVLSTKITELRQRAEAVGRDPLSIKVSVLSVPPERDTIQRLERIGVDRVIFDLPSDTKENILPLLEKCSTARS
ncbi:LLM class F420-dependent oxidoreductase [SAR202 cluster bacterium AD-804-J14_MRT_500m]|nr:LLM class F420-dependent oxidoreductase [SAR202 cluster bacterium AD-804-J14_MRT_500m]